LPDTGIIRGWNRKIRHTKLSDFKYLNRCLEFDILKNPLLYRNATAAARTKRGTMVIPIVLMLMLLMLLMLLLFWLFWRLQLL